MAATLLLTGGGVWAADEAGATGQAAPAAASASGPGGLPPSGVRLELTPAREGPWHLRLTNGGDAPVRLLADGRLLWLEVIEAPAPLDPKKKTQPKARAMVRGKLPVCRAPAELRPEGEIAQRVLLLRPGERYDEDIDPMLVCGAGKVMAGLRPGAMVYAHYGYAPSTARLKKGALPPPPYVVESLSEPRDLLPLRSVDGEGGIYFSDYIPPAPVAAPVVSAAPAASASAAAPAASGSAGPDPAASAMPPAGATPPALVDGRGPRMVVRTAALLDAGSATDVTMTVTLANEGQRSALLHFRGDDVGFTVTTPGGEVVRCERGGGQRGAVRDFFETLGPGKRHSVTLRLYEICPVATFRQPGIYSVLADVNLQQDGDAYNLPATVAEVKAEAPSKLRVRTGRDPYHRSPPVVSSGAAAAPDFPVTP